MAVPPTYGAIIQPTPPSKNAKKEVWDKYYADMDAFYARQAQLEQMGPDAQKRMPLPGEDFQQYQQRMSDTGQINFAQNPTEAMDNYKLFQLQGETEAKARGTLGEQKTIADQRLKDLSSFLASEENRKFNQAIPEIAESSQAQGFLETSGFGSALARERAKLVGDTSARLTEQGLADRDLEIRGVGGIGQNYNDLAVGGLERTYSTGDLTRSEALSRELARLGVVNPKEPSSTDKILQNAGPILSGVGAVKAAG